LTVFCILQNKRRKFEKNIDLIERTGGCLQNDTIVELDEGGFAKNSVLGLPDSHDFDLIPHLAENRYNFLLVIK
ncbi:MAG: hypothetical protein U9N72_10690, partial [Bacteroidota bacterium]|nr:hypothetical protein [Bacteroidota bacterium]